MHGLWVFVPLVVWYAIVWMSEFQILREMEAELAVVLGG